METVIDWSKAPDWAMAYAQVIYEHETTAKDFAWVSADGYNVNPFGQTEQVCHPYMKRSFTADRFRLIEFRPAKDQAWTGEGLPPVGTHIEASTTEGWRRAEVVGLHDGHVIVSRRDADLVFQYEPKHSSALRPIRTPEQIAAEERSSAIKEMASVVNGRFGERAAEELYDAGYRKQVQP